MMTESRYHQLVGDAFRKIEDAIADCDPADVDVDSAGDVLTITLKEQHRCIVNTQRPTRQIWLAWAAKGRAWHFSWDDAQSKWLDDKGHGDELFATLHAIVKDATDVDIAI
jgi:CyaY protein